jgi:hypothetical protein
MRQEDDEMTDDEMTTTPPVPEEVHPWSFTRATADLLRDWYLSIGTGTCLVVRYDVTNLTREQIDALAGEAAAQAEASENHPDVRFLAAEEMA